MSDSSHTPLQYATPQPRSRRRIGIFLSLLILMFLLGVAVALILGSRTVRYTAVGTVVVATVPAVVPPKPSRLTIIQRTEQPLAGTNGTIVARLGDVTAGQVLFTLEDSDGQPLVNTVSMREGDVQRFIVGNDTYEIELVELKNFLTGDDFAVFEVRQAATALSEAEKIQRLIEAVAGAQDITFIRNGAPYSGADAAAHLLRKHQAAEEQGLTARQFIEHIASRSSMSGEAYRVRLEDGREINSEQWLTARLREIEAKPSATQPARPYGGSD